MSKGLIIGKFMPPHRGHELLIDVGSATTRHLDVLVSGRESDTISVASRAWWLEHYFSSKGFRSERINFIRDIHDDPDPVVDENGTAVDEAYWQIWIDKLKKMGQYDYLFSSDLYGERLAREIGARWVPVDPNRKTVPISATKIRNGLRENFDYLIPPAKINLSKKVAIVGAESTGKSTMTAMLAKKFQIEPVLEYGRTLSEHRPDLDQTDFKIIVETQSAMIQHAAAQAPLVITDTEAYTTYLFSELYLDTPAPSAFYRSITQDFDLYILLASNVSWVDDGTRMLADQEQRVVFENKMLQYLKDQRRNYVIVDDVNFDDRFNSAVTAINNLIGDYHV